jgi:hypothetical protein
VTTCGRLSGINVPADNETQMFFSFTHLKILKS